MVELFRIQSYLDCVCDVAEGEELLVYGQQTRQWPDLPQAKHDPREQYEAREANLLDC